MYYLAYNWYCQGKDSKAAEQARRAVRGFERLYGPQAPEVLDARRLLSRIQKRIEASLDQDQNA